MGRENGKKMTGLDKIMEGVRGERSNSVRAGGTEVRVVDQWKDFWKKKRSDEGEEEGEEEEKMVRKSRVIDSPRETDLELRMEMIEVLREIREEMKRIREEMREV